MEGYVKLFRSITTHWIFENPLYLKAWVDILMRVNWKDKKLVIDGEVRNVERGSTITSQVKLADAWGCTRPTVKKILTLLEEEGMIVTEVTRHFTYLKVCNFNDYQGCRDNAFDNKVYSGVYNTVYNGVYNGVYTKEERKEREEGKEGKNIRVTSNKSSFIPPTLEEVKEYCMARNNGIDAQSFVDYYEARGWKVGKGVAMEDWKAMVRTWEKNKHDKPKEGGLRF